MHMDPKLIYQLRESYRSCLMDDGFFSDFYSAFFASSDTIKAKSTNANMLKQRAMLAEGVTKLLAFVETGEVSSRFLELAELHSKKILMLILRFIQNLLMYLFRQLRSMIKICQLKLSKHGVTP